MSGNCATGMRSIDSAPAIVITIAMTIARRGRSTKTEEIIAQCPAVSVRRAAAAAARRRAARAGVPLAAAGWPGWSVGRRPPRLPPRGGRVPHCAPGGTPGPGAGGSRRDRMPGRTRWMPSTTTISPSVSPDITTATSAVDWPSCDAALLDLVLGVNDKDVVALLVRQDRGARNGERLDRLRSPSTSTVTNCPSISARLTTSPGRRRAQPAGWGSPPGSGSCRCSWRRSDRRSRSCRPGRTCCRPRGAA